MLINLWIGITFQWSLHQNVEGISPFSRLQLPPLCQNTADIVVIVFPWIRVEMKRSTTAFDQGVISKKLDLTHGLVPWLKQFFK